tara:strand:+ start:939 stop:1115 length:177 start_codon:yes stop_codon:yes gene_type:complete
MRRIIEFFTKEDQDEKLIRKMKEYEQKEKTKQQKSKVYGQKLVKQTRRKEKSTSVYNS